MCQYLNAKIIDIFDINKFLSRKSSIDLFVNKVQMASGFPQSLFNKRQESAAVRQCGSAAFRI